MSGPSVTVVMPALNEAGNIDRAAGNVLDVFSRTGIDGQLYIINDGSSDTTGELAEQLSRQDERVQVVHHPSPCGIGGSFWDGVQRANGEIVVMLPGDGENDAAEILRYLPLLEQVDIVVPYVFNRAVRSPARRLLSIVYREIIKATFGLSLNYMNGTVMYRRSILQDMKLRNPGFFYQSELLIRCIRRGYLYAEVPYALSRRSGGDSKATTFASLCRIMCGYLGMIREVLTEGASLPLVTTSATSRRLKELNDAAL